jgi:hypothetical protein
MLDDVMRGNKQDIVSWQSHGKAFRVHKPREFAMHIMPRHFKQTHYKSFQRQLHIYGFHRITGKGMHDDGAYYHDMFIHGEKQLSLRMVRQKIKGPDAYDTYGHPDPDFYAQQPTQQPQGAPVQQQQQQQHQQQHQQPFVMTEHATPSPRTSRGKIFSPEMEDLLMFKSSTLSSLLLEGGLPLPAPSSAVIAMEEEKEEAEEMFFAGKKFFCVEPRDQQQRKQQQQQPPLKLKSFFGVEARDQTPKSLPLRAECVARTA